MKEVIADPHQSCVLIHTRVEGDADVLAKLKLFALLSPHLELVATAITETLSKRIWERF